MLLVTGEVALSFLLLVGAGLLIRSFTQLVNVNLDLNGEPADVFGEFAGIVLQERGR